MKLTIKNFLALGVGRRTLIYMPPTHMPPMNYSENEFNKFISFARNSIIVNGILNSNSKYHIPILLFAWLIVIPVTWVIMWVIVPIGIIIEIVEGCVEFGCFGGCFGSSPKVNVSDKNSMPSLLIDVDGKSIPNPEWNKKMKEIMEKIEQKKAESVEIV